MNTLITTLWILIVMLTLCLLTFVYHYEQQNDINPHAVRHVLGSK